MLFLEVTKVKGKSYPIGLQKIEAPIISRQSAHEGGKVVSPIHQPPKD
jgi:hypothetical protein